MVHEGKEGDVVVTGREPEDVASLVTVLVKTTGVDEMGVGAEETG